MNWGSLFTIEKLIKDLEHINGRTQMMYYLEFSKRKQFSTVTNKYFNDKENNKNIL